MSRRYAPVPNPLTHDAEREMDAAFQSDNESDDDEGHGETTPLNPRNTSASSPISPTAGDDGDTLPLPNAGTDAENQSQTIRPTHHHQRRQTLPGTYDFEADPFDYAVPPPGSPPGPTTHALPNQYGNTNGIIPTFPVIPPSRPEPREGAFASSSTFFRRAVGALLPSYYQRVPTGEGYTGPVRGGGTNNDGVFANLTAKPSP